MAEAIKVLIIDDHPLFRHALELALIKAKISPHNIHHAGKLAEALALMPKHTFSLILLDLNLDDSQDFEGLSKIRARDQGIPIIVISATESQLAFETARSLGAVGYIPKSSSLDNIKTAVQSALAGEHVFPESVSDGAASDLKAAQSLSSLTPAQHRVMNCLSDGLLNKQIAYEMSISEATVKAHLTAIFRKLGANNRTQALLMFRNATRL